MDPFVIDFLTAQGWPPEQATAFPADWSARRYARLRRAAPPASAILMQTAPDADFHSFIRVAGVLRAAGLAAPEIYALDAPHGLLLLEDFGDRNFGRLLDGGAEPWPLLQRAVTALCRVQQRTVALTAPDLPHYDTARFIAQLAPVLENFSYADPVGAASAFQEVWHRALVPIATQPTALLLRDYIADNLMDIPPRPDGQDVGLLDFELAGIGPLGYDLVSLLEQVRRDLSPELRAQVVDEYLRHWPELDAATFRASLPILAVQRHARTFARLRKMQKPDFYIRCFSFLQRGLQEPECAALRGWFTRFLPEYFA